MEASNIIEIVTTVFACVSALCVAFGCIYNRAQAIHQYYLKMEDIEFIKIRSKVYNEEPKILAKEDNIDAAVIINVFNHWGTLVKYHYLPIKFFYNGNGEAILLLYERVKGHIETMRKKENRENYANDFIWLVEKLRKKLR